MTTLKLAPSILSADFSRLGEEIRQALDCGADYIHVDVMDGAFVPNITIGVPVLKSLRKAFPEVFFDVHLMIREPVRFVEAFAKAGASLLMFHAEADTEENISLALEKAKALGCKTGVALKPATPASVLERWLPSLDMALVMTVEPGFGGQSFMYDQLPKIRDLRRRIGELGLSCDIEVDGGIAPDTAPLVIEAGANVLVAGSAVFGQRDRAAAMASLRM